MVEKVIWSLNSRFDLIVATIQESKDLKTLKIEELWSSLEARELRVIDREA